MEEYLFGDTKLCYKVIGEGKPVLIIHGWGLDYKIMSGCLEPVFSKKDDVFKRIYIDIPGMGKSKAGSDIKTSDDILRVIMGFVDYIIPGENFLVIGESYGGYLARGLVKNISSRIYGLILLCPLVFPGTRVGRVVPLKVMEKDEAFLATLTEQERSSFEYMNVILTKKVWDRYKVEIHDVIFNRDPYFIDNVLEGSCLYDVDDLEEVFTKPCLIIVGKQDTEVGYLDQFDLLKKYTGATYVALNRAGHNLQIEQPEMFSQIVEIWLDDNMNEFNY